MSEEGGTGSHLKVSISIDSSEVVEDLKKMDGPPGEVESETVKDMQESITTLEQGMADLQSSLQLQRISTLDEPLGEVVERFQMMIQEHSAVFRQLYGANYDALISALGSYRLISRIDPSIKAQIPHFRHVVDVMQQIRTRGLQENMEDVVGTGLGPDLGAQGSFQEMVNQAANNMVNAITRRTEGSAMMHTVLQRVSQQILSGKGPEAVATLEERLIPGMLKPEDIDLTTLPRLDIMLREAGEPSEAIEIKTHQMRRGDFRFWIANYMQAILDMFTEEGVDEEEARKRASQLRYTFIAPSFAKTGDLDNFLAEAQRQKFGDIFTPENVRLVAYEREFGINEALAEVLLEAVEEYPDLSDEQISQLQADTMTRILGPTISQGKPGGGLSKEDVKKVIRDRLQTLPKEERYKGSGFAREVQKARTMARYVQREAAGRLPERRADLPRVAGLMDRGVAPELPSREAAELVHLGTAYEWPLAGVELREGDPTQIRGYMQEVQTEYGPRREERRITQSLRRAMDTPEEEITVAGRQFTQADLLRAGYFTPDKGHRIYKTTGGRGTRPHDEVVADLERLDIAEPAPVAESRPVDVAAEQFAETVQELEEELLEVAGFEPTGRQQQLAGGRLELLYKWGEEENWLRSEALDRLKRDRRHGVGFFEEREGPPRTEEEEPEGIPDIIEDMASDFVETGRAVAEHIVASATVAAAAPPSSAAPTDVRTSRIFEAGAEIAGDPERRARMLAGAKGRERLIKEREDAMAFAKIGRFVEEEEPTRPEWEGFETPTYQIMPRQHAALITAGEGKFERTAERVRMDREVYDFIKKLKQSMEAFSPDSTTWQFLDSLKQQAGDAREILKGIKESDAGQAINFVRASIR